MEREGRAFSEGPESLSDNYMVNLHQSKKRSSRFGKELDEFEISVRNREFCSGENWFWKEKDDGGVKNFKKTIKQHLHINWFKTPRLESWGRWSLFSRRRSSWKKRGTDSAKKLDLLDEGYFDEVQVKGPSGKDKGLQLFNLQGGPSGKDKELQLFNMQKGDQRSGSRNGEVDNWTSASGDMGSETGFEKKEDAGVTGSLLLLQRGKQTKEIDQSELYAKFLKYVTDKNEDKFNDSLLIKKGGPSDKEQGMQLLDLQQGEQMNNKGQVNDEVDDWASARRDWGTTSCLEEEVEEGAINTGQLMLQNGKNILDYLDLRDLTGGKEDKSHVSSLIKKTKPSHEEQQLRFREKQLYRSTREEKEFEGPTDANNAASSEISHVRETEDPQSPRYSMTNEENQESKICEVKREKQAQRGNNTQKEIKDKAGVRKGFSKGFMLSLRGTSTESKLANSSGAQVDYDMRRSQDRRVGEKTYCMKEIYRRSEGPDEENSEEAILKYYGWLDGGNDQRKSCCNWMADRCKTRGGMMGPKAATTIKIKFTKGTAAYSARQQLQEGFQRPAGYMSCMAEPVKIETQIIYSHHMDQRKSEWEGVPEHVACTVVRRKGGKENWFDRKFRSRSKGRRCRKVIACTVTVNRNVGPKSTKKAECTIHACINLWVIKIQPTNSTKAQKDKKPVKEVKDALVRTRSTHWKDGKRREGRIRAAKKRQTDRQRNSETQTAVTSTSDICERNSNNTESLRCGKACLLNDHSRLWQVILYDKRRWDKWKLTC